MSSVVENFHFHPGEHRARRDKGKESSAGASLATGQVRLETEASLVARPFFESRGFTVLGEETVERAGIAMPRFRMRKHLVAPVIRPDGVMDGAA